MRLPRTLLLICALVLSIAAADGASGTTLNVYLCPEGECRSDYDCFNFCCSRYGCDPAWPPFCVKDFQTPSGCGVCFC